ncbi:hypothetical protein [Pseudoalteromonas denitrificans]|uniref:Tail fiber protein n=1 Tax=Pseudoalteromonas denitrificans DSM 6059 TaxID=1123010 RepID=A0A1I1Q3N7_9GAMM|nr:hypothetical protein [Pseudoalteromonas denitrificans]SFD16659.1 hypothetical protein SAMN02745724_03723 [Pseudoalteromonas denitrificans DSM 6059]
MSTISNLTQIMVDKMALEMQGQTPLSPEEQLLVAKALDTMKNNTTFETALVAVAEEHLNTATAILKSAETAIDAAKLDIAAKATALNMIEGISTISGNTATIVGEISSTVNTIKTASVIKSIQRGEQSLTPNAETNVSVTSVNPTKSVLNVSCKSGYAGYNAGNHMALGSTNVGGKITSATNLYFKNSTGPWTNYKDNAVVYWELIEYV